MVDVHPHGPSVSFIVPARDEEQVLGRCLVAVHVAARALELRYELLVVDDASADRTPILAREGGAEVVAIDRSQIAAARNAGARASRGERLVFVDADTIVDAEALGAALRALDAGAVGRGSLVRFDRPIPAYGCVLELLAVPVYHLAGLASGCFLFCTRRAFEATGGFDETLFAGEEAALSRALGRHGRFAVLRERVVPSGRKLRTHRAREVLACLGRMLVRPRRTLTRRAGLELHYGPRRIDPAPGADEGGR